MADGYSKIKAASKFKSRSIDYSDLSSLPHSLKFNATVANPNSLSHESDQNRANRAQSCLPEEEEEEEECGGGASELSRSGSVSSSAASGFHSAVKRALSMRRSSSVAERYCRIHDQFATLASPIEDEEIGEGDSKERRKSAGSMRRRKKKNAAEKIVRACKRLFGL